MFLIVFLCLLFHQQLLKALPVLQQQIDALLEVDVCLTFFVSNYPLLFFLPVIH